MHTIMVFKNIIVRCVINYGHFWSREIFTTPACISLWPRNLTYWHFHCGLSVINENCDWFIIVYCDYNCLWLISDWLIILFFFYRLSRRYFQVSRNPLRLGKVYKKAIFREFTDATYTVLKAREPWQGILGPTIRGEVGDMAIVHFFNNASMLLSMHPHGSRYIKVHEGKSKFLKHFNIYSVQGYTGSKNSR